MPGLDEIRKRKLEELMRRQLSQKNSQEESEQAQIAQQIEIMEETVKQFLTKDALARYGNLKAAHQEKALSVLMLLYQAIKRGQVPKEIDDTVLKKVLEQITPAKKDFKIKRV